MGDGILYFAMGERYMEMSQEAVARTASAWPRVKVAVIIVEGEPKEDVMGLRIRALMESPFDKTLYLDADTWLVRPVPELFEVLGRFDVAMAHAPWRERYPALVPKCFPEHNGGVMAYRKSTTEGFLDDWLATFEKHIDVKEKGDGTGYFPSQPSMREALYRSGLRICTLPPEYNWRGAGYVQKRVLIVHGGGEKGAERINRDPDSPRTEFDGEVRVWR